MARIQHSVWICVLLCLLGITTLAADQKVMGVQIKEGQLRLQPSFLGKVVATVAYGTPLTILEEQGDWFKATLGKDGANGWIHKSALTKKAINLKAGQNVSQVQERELVIAGKGFNQQVEQEFKLNNKTITFDWVDRMEKNFAVSQEAQQKFLKEGGLTPEGGSL